jgi:FkbM family methyltransferase
MIPQTIHFTIPASPSAAQLQNIELARKLHPDWQVVVWQDPVDPAPFVLSKYWSKVNSGAQLADLIRLEVVHRQGGFYLDADFELKRSLEPLRIYPFVIASEDGMALTNAFFGAEEGSPALKQLIDKLSASDIDWKLPPVVTTGPEFFARELKWRKDVTVLPRESFYPYGWRDEPAPSREWTYGAHLWEHSWRASRGPRRPVRGLIGRAKAVLKPFALKSLIAFRAFLLRAKRLLHLDRGSAYPAAGVICAQTVHGPKILLHGEDVTVTPSIALNGSYEFEEEIFVKRLVRHGDWVIDVGANVGILSLLSADSVGPFGRVFCYEPNPLPASLLKKSLVMNWCHERVEVREKALGSESGVSRLRFSREVLGGATLAVTDNAATIDSSLALLGTQDEVDVQVSTLDTDFPVNLPIRLLKIDAEGFEHHVLRGGRRLLENKCVDVLMLECVEEVYGQNWPLYLREIERLTSFGYVPYKLTRSSKLRPIAFSDIIGANRSRNIVLISRPAIATIRELS